MQLARMLWERKLWGLKSNLPTPVKPLLQRRVLLLRRCVLLLRRCVLLPLQPAKYQQSELPLHLELTRRNPQLPTALAVRPYKVPHRFDMRCRQVTSRADFQQTFPHALLLQEHIFLLQKIDI